MENEPSSNFYFIGIRRKTETITETAYTIFLSVTFLLWILLLLIVRVRFAVKISDADLYAYAAVAAGLGAIAVGILAVVHEVNVGQRFLKVGLGTLSFLFVSSCLCCILSITQFTKDMEVCPAVSLYLVFALAFVLIASLSGRILKVRAYLFFPFVAPFLPYLTASDHVLAVTALLMLAGGTIGLIVLTAVLVVCILLVEEKPSESDELVSLELKRRRDDDERRKQLEELKETILGVLRLHRASHIAAKVFDDADARLRYRSSILLDLEEIVDKLKQQKIFAGESLVRRALSDLSTENIRLFHELSPSRYYIAPTLEDIGKAEQALSRFVLIAIEYDRSEVDLSFDLFATYLASRLNYPVEVIEDRVMPALLSALDDPSRFQSTEWRRKTGGLEERKAKLYLSSTSELGRALSLLRAEVRAAQQYTDARDGQVRLLTGRLEATEVFPLSLKESLLADEDGRVLRQAVASM